MSQLALLGGTPVRTKPFPVYNSIGEEERQAADRVIRSGNLSGFIGSWCPSFYGGPEVQALESEWAAQFHVQHCVAMNSATSGLIAACMALGLGPGDEVVVTPYSMCISATAPLHVGAKPVFADIDPETYNISADTIAPVITERTKAIIVVHLFGQPADMDPILALAEKYDLKIIEDCAQAPLAGYRGRYVGSIGDIGVFSLNQRKIITCGEGGVCTTDDSHLAEKLQLVRNHGEAVVGHSGRVSGWFRDCVGHNFRLGEIEAAIAREQLKKLPVVTEKNKACVTYLNRKMMSECGMRSAAPNGDHVYYVHPVAFEEDKFGIHRDVFVKAMNAEGVPVKSGYVKPLCYLPIFDQPSAVERSSLPNVHAAQYSRVIVHDLIRPGLTTRDLDDVAYAFAKVKDNSFDLWSRTAAA